MSRVINRLPFGLSPTEMAIIRGCVDGRKHDAVAGDLHIHPQTLKNHLTSAYRKMGASNIAHAVALLDDYAPDWRPPLSVPMGAVA